MFRRVLLHTGRVDKLLAEPLPGVSASVGGSNINIDGYYTVIVSVTVCIASTIEVLRVSSSLLLPIIGQLYMQAGLYCRSHLRAIPLSALQCTVLTKL